MVVSERDTETGTDATPRDMADSGDKIVIRPQDLSPERDDRIVIASGDLAETASGDVAETGGDLTETVSGDTGETDSADSSTTTSLDKWRLMVSTLVPFWNAWTWWRLPVRRSSSSRCSRQRPRRRSPGNR